MNIKTFFIFFLFLIPIPSQGCWPFKKKCKSLPKTLTNHPLLKPAVIKSHAEEIEVAWTFWSHFQIKSDQVEEVEESALCPLPVSACKKNNCFHHRLEQIGTDQTTNIYAKQEILRLAIYQGTNQELVFILNRHPEILCRPLDREKGITPLAYAKALIMESQRTKAFYAPYGITSEWFILNSKMSTIKLLMWKQSFKKAYQEDKVQLPFKQTYPALDAIIIEYLVDPCKPFQQQIQNKQKQLEKK
jgi:hypothetical protein